MTRLHLSWTKHMSQTGTSGSFQATRLFLSRQLWAWPLIAALVLGGIGWWVNRSVEDAMRKRMAEELTTILKADITALRLWLKEAQADAQSLSLDPSIQEEMKKLIAQAGPDEDPADRLRNSPILAEVR